MDVLLIVSFRGVTRPVNYQTHFQTSSLEGLRESVSTGSLNQLFSWERTYGKYQPDEPLRPQGPSAAQLFHQTSLLLSLCTARTRDLLCGCCLSDDDDSRNSFLLALYLSLRGIASSHFCQVRRMSREERRPRRRRFVRCPLELLLIRRAPFTEMSGMEGAPPLFEYNKL